MELEFTTTACNRPQLLRNTYGSFSRNLKCVDFGDCTLHINVDPQPDGKGRYRVVEVAEHFFGTVDARLPAESSFPDAVRWTWNRVDSEFFFNLEDDWNLMEEVNVRSLARSMDRLRNSEPLQIILRHSPKHGPNWVKNKPEYEEIVDPGLPPMLARTSLVKPVVQNWDAGRNPEKHFRDWYKSQSPNASPYMWPSHKITKDIGRNWREQRDLVKSRIRDENGEGEPGDWDTWRKQNP